MRQLTWFRITALPQYTYWIAAERSGFAAYGIPSADGSYAWMTRVAGKLREGKASTIEKSKEAAEASFTEAESGLGWANI